MILYLKRNSLMNRMEYLDICRQILQNMGQRRKVYVWAITNGKQLLTVNSQVTVFYEDIYTNIHIQIFLKKVVNYILRSRMSLHCKYLLYLTFVSFDTVENKFYFKVYRNVFQVASSRQEFSQNARIIFQATFLKGKFV